MIAGPKLNTPISASNKSRSNQPTRAKQQSQPVTAIQQSSKMPGGSPRPSFKRTYCPPQSGASSAVHSRARRSSICSKVSNALTLLFGVLPSVFGSNNAVPFPECQAQIRTYTELHGCQPTDIGVFYPRPGAGLSDLCGNITSDQARLLGRLEDGQKGTCSNGVYEDDWRTCISYLINATSDCNSTAWIAPSPMPTPSPESNSFTERPYSFGEILTAVFIPLLAGLRNHHVLSAHDKDIALEDDNQSDQESGITAHDKKFNRIKTLIDKAILSNDGRVLTSELVFTVGIFAMFLGNFNDEGQIDSFQNSTGTASATADFLAQGAYSRPIIYSLSIVLWDLVKQRLGVSSDPYPSQSVSHPLTLCIESLKKPQKNKSVITQLRSVLEGSRYRKLPLKETALSVLMLARRNYAIDPALDGILIVASLLGGSLIQKFVDVSSGTGRLDAIIHELQKNPQRPSDGAGQ